MMMSTRIILLLLIFAGCSKTEILINESTTARAKLPFSRIVLLYGDEEKGTIQEFDLQTGQLNFETVIPAASGLSIQYVDQQFYSTQAYQSFFQSRINEEVRGHSILVRPDSLFYLDGYGSFLLSGNKVIQKGATDRIAFQAEHKIARGYSDDKEWIGVMLDFERSWSGTKVNVFNVKSGEKLHLEIQTLVEGITYDSKGRIFAHASCRIYEIRAENNDAVLYDVIPSHGCWGIKKLEDDWVAYAEFIPDLLTYSYLLKIRNLATSEEVPLARFKIKHDDKFYWSFDIE